MTDRTIDYVAPASDPLAGRRIFFALIVLASMVGLVWLLTYALSAGGFGVTDFILVVMFAVTLPWSVIGFWNATIGLFLMRFSADPVAAVTPVSARVRGDEPITTKTAVLWWKACSVFKPDYFVDYLPDNPWIHQPFEVYDNLRPEEVGARLPAKA